MLEYTMRLHTFVGSPNGRKVEAVIHHLQLPVQIVHHDFVGGALRTEKFLALNPNGKVPVLEDGPFTLWESNAIMQYLAEKAGRGGLLPEDLQSRADIARWLFWEQRHFNRALGALAFELVAKPALGLERDPHQIERAQEDLARFAPVLERAVAGRRHLVGGQLTVADYAMVAFESYRPVTPFDWSKFPAINTYFDSVRATPAWSQASAANRKAA
jgi:glutathione S-transferase